MLNYLDADTIEVEICVYGTTYKVEAYIDPEGMDVIEVFGDFSKEDYPEAVRQVEDAIDDELETISEYERECMQESLIW